MRKLITFSLCFISAAALLCSCGNSSRKAQEQQAAEQAAADSVAAAQLEKQVMEKIATLPAEPVFDIITSMGVIKVKLYSDTPRHRENFAKLALEKYYDGTLFHRVINGFMIQGGDPLSPQGHQRLHDPGRRPPLQGSGQQGQVRHRRP